MSWNPEDHYSEIHIRIPGSDNPIFALRKYHQSKRWYPFWLHEANTIKPLGEPDFSDEDLDKAIDNFVSYRSTPRPHDIPVRFVGNWQVVND